MPEKIFYHGSPNALPPGFLLKGRNDEFWNNLQDTNAYFWLEKFRPQGMIAHKDAIFMCGNLEDIDVCGGSTKWLFKLEPLSRVERHDMNWGSAISAYLDEIQDSQDLDVDYIKKLAENYWNGIPHADENLWEYLCEHVKIISVEALDVDLEDKSSMHQS